MIDLRRKLAPENQLRLKGAPSLRFVWEGFMLVCLLVLNPASAAVEMHGLFTSGMIFQRDENVAVYGSANVGEVVTVQFAGQSKVGAADADGQWKVFLDPMAAASTGSSVTVTSDQGTNILLTDILVGDIWIVSGQSNMDRWFQAYAIAQQDIVGVSNDQIRIFRSDNSKGSLTPKTEVEVFAGFDGGWQIAEETYLNRFSPAGYYLADRLNQELNIPIGIIQAGLGATNIESWLPGFLVESTQEYEFMTGEQWPSNVMSQAEIDAGDEMARKGTSGLYHYTVAPLREFSFKGFAWCQGESSSRRPWIYRSQMPDLITAWRQDFGDPDAPFLVVEIAPYGGYNYERAAWLREAQALARTLPNTGYVTTVDIGEFTDIHPQDKRSVGDRLAYLALEMDGLAYNGQPPSYKSTTVVGNTLEIDFNLAATLSSQEVRMNRDAGLPIGQDPNAYVVPAGTVAGFEICAVDQVFVEADAVISGGKVIVSASGISDPVAARYAWKNFPLANLTSGDGRAVPPFRTDEFVGPFHPPVFDTEQFTATVDRDAVFGASMSATDPNGGSLSYAVVSFDGPDADWLSIDPSTGAISGTPLVEGGYNWVVSVRDEAFNDANSFNVAYASIELSVGPPGDVQTAFIYPTPVSTDAGVFNAGTGIEKLVNAGFTAPSDVDSDAGGLGNSYVSLESPGFPVTLTMTFASATDLDAFYLWNHAHNNLAGQTNNGVNSFDLEFYSDTAATVPISSITGLSAAKAPQTGDIPAQTFAFSQVDGVQAVKLVIQSNHGGGFLALREIGFGAVLSPPDFIYPTPGSSDSGQFNGSTGIENLVNMGFASPSEMDSDAGGLGNSYVSLGSPAFPVTLTLTFASATKLNAFYLWNHASNNLAGQTNNGVNSFDLEFYSDTAATVAISSITGLSAVKAPQTGDIPAQTFAFSQVDGVQAVKLVIQSNHGGGFVAVREIGFGAAPGLSLSLSLSGFTYDQTNGDAEVSILGAASTNYKLVEAADLDFGSPDQDPVLLTVATVGTLDGNEVTTDGSGNATVQFNLGTGGGATFIRGETP